MTAIDIMQIFNIEQLLSYSGENKLNSIRRFPKFDNEQNLELIELPFGKLRILLNKGEPFVYYATFVADENSRLHLQKGDVVIDAGANVGDFTIKAAIKVGKFGKVIALEPNAHNVQILKKNIERNNLQNVVIIEKALSNKDGTTLFSGNGVGASIMDNSQGITVETVSFKSLFETYCKATEKVVVKMDIEGAEQLVFKDPKFLERVREISMELHGDKNVREIPKKLRAANFKVLEYTVIIQIINSLKNFVKHPFSIISAEIHTNFIASRGALSSVLGKNPVPSVKNNELKIIYAKKL